MKEHKLEFIVVGIILALLLITNPSRETHLDKYANYLQNNFTNGNIWTGIMLPAALKANTVTNNYYLFSITNMNSGARHDNITFGILGFVIITDKGQYSKLE